MSVVEMVSVDVSVEVSDVVVSTVVVSDVDADVVVTSLLDVTVELSVVDVSVVELVAWEVVVSTVVVDEFCVEELVTWEVVVLCPVDVLVDVLVDVFVFVGRGVGFGIVEIVDELPVVFADVVPLDLVVVREVLVVGRDDWLDDVSETPGRPTLKGRQTRRPGRVRRRTMFRRCSTASSSSSRAAASRNTVRAPVPDSPGVMVPRLAM